MSDTGGQPKPNGGPPARAARFAPHPGRCHHRRLEGLYVLGENCAECDVLIVGAGPAGVSTALHLAGADPAWAGRILLIDQAEFPRDKLCGGGITRLGEDVLGGLGLSIPEPRVAVREVQLRHGRRRFALRADPVFHIVRRMEFDHWLVEIARRRHIRVQTATRVQQVTALPEGFEIGTDRGVIRTRCLVAADGACSVVRRKLGWHDHRGRARLLETLSACRQAAAAVERGVAVFDFDATRAGLQGYCWDFPTRLAGQPRLSRGVFDSRLRPERAGVSLRRTLARWTGGQRCTQGVRGFPIRRFDPRATFARERALLVGDAAGVDPLFGEGIAFALAYGRVAARALRDGFATGDFSFSQYREQMAADPVTGQLWMRHRAARLAYRFRQPWLQGLLWSLAPVGLWWLARRNPAYVPVTDPHLVRVHG